MNVYTLQLNHTNQRGRAMTDAGKITFNYGADREIGEAVDALIKLITAEDDMTYVQMVKAILQHTIDAARLVNRAEFERSVSGIDEVIGDPEITDDQQLADFGGLTKAEAAGLLDLSEAISVLWQFTPSQMSAALVAGSMAEPVDGETSYIITLNAINNKMEP